VDLELEKTENFLTISLVPQYGQTMFPSVTSISRFSNTLPQRLHSYSLIGNFTTSSFKSCDAAPGEKVSC
jgi:hypothetical protein